MARKTSGRSTSWTRVLLTEEDRLRHRLQQRHWLRLHAALTGGLSLVGMSVISLCLLHAGVHSMALRYGVAVGDEGRAFSGSAHIPYSRNWPSWRPTENMIMDQPETYGPLRAGLPGGPGNPLRARALYLHRGNKDTFYRIHGTMDPSSVGKATSAGCIRLFNQDIMDLFDEIPNGTRVKVRSRAESLALEGQMIEQPNGYLARASSVQTAAAPAQ